jgi:tRNA nucleotidyltransferase/poly(A) polymerase
VLEYRRVKKIEDYVRSLDLDAYLVGGAVRDELLGRESKDADFLVPGMDAPRLQAALAPHGKVEELVVARRPVGMRLYPRDRTMRELAPAGIEFAPLRLERSTGPGRHDFEIVVDPTASVEDDLGRRDFTINAIARRLSDGELVDPFGGRADLEARRLRTVTERSFSEDPLRLVRGLRFVSQLGLDPDESTLAQMHEHAGKIAIVSGERIGGGLTADGLGELSKLLLGGEPRKALRLARDTGVLVALLPDFEPAIGFDPGSPDHRLGIDEHTFAVVQAAADSGTPLRVRLATLLHDLGKPVTPAGGNHAEIGAGLAARALGRLRYPTDLRRRVVRIVRFHPFDLGSADALEARQLLARHGEGLVFDLLDHWHADLRGRDRNEQVVEKLEQLAAFRETVEQERGSPHRLSDLAVDGTDLIQLGYAPGPALGRALQELLEEVVGRPGLNRRETLLARAEELLHT